MREFHTRCLRQRDAKDVRCRSYAWIAEAAERGWCLNQAMSCAAVVMLAGTEGPTVTVYPNFAANDTDAKSVNGS